MTITIITISCEIVRIEKHFKKPVPAAPKSISLRGATSSRDRDYPHQKYIYQFHHYENAVNRQPVEKPNAQFN